MQKLSQELLWIEAKDIWYVFIYFLFIYLVTNLIILVFMLS